MKRSLLVLAVLLGFSTFSFAADLHCGRGSDGSDNVLWDGYHLRMAPSEEHPEMCHAALVGADGNAIFETDATEMWMLGISGKDVNADGKPDVVLETVSANPCCYRYFIVTPGASPALVREVTTTPRLTFAALEGSDHVDITTHEVVYLGIDGLDRDVSPAPMVVLRMRGASFYPVSQVYWDQYQHEIEMTKATVPQSAFDKFFGKPSASDDQKPKEPSEEDLRLINRAKAAVLVMYLDYLYGGHPQEGMKVMSEMWPDRDKDRIRQIILQLRMHGVMGEINRPPAQTAAAPAKPGQ